jgi:hypothetical protein
MDRRAPLGSTETVGGMREGQASGMTRKDVVYNVLRDHANQFVSGNTLVAAGAGYRFGARIHELRKAGHVIEERKAKDSAVSEYRLVIEDVAPGQVALWDAA